MNHKPHGIVHKEIVQDNNPPAARDRIENECQTKARLIAIYLFILEEVV
jgi:hypothetical protein